MVLVELSGAGSAAFVLGHGIEFKQLGVGMATAVLIDALMVRAFVLPALLTVLGDKVWWPSRPTGSGLPADAEAFSCSP